MTYKERLNSIKAFETDVKCTADNPNDSQCVKVQADRTLHIYTAGHSWIKITPTRAKEIQAELNELFPTEAEKEKPWTPEIGEAVRIREVKEVIFLVQRKIVCNLYVIVGKEGVEFSARLEELRPAPGCRVEIVESKDKELKVWCERTQSGKFTLKVLEGSKFRHHPTHGNYESQTLSDALKSLDRKSCHYFQSEKSFDYVIKTIASYTRDKPVLKVGGWALFAGSAYKLILGPSKNGSWIVSYVGEGGGEGEECLINQALLIPLED